MRANWTWGSRIKVRFNWGDGSSDENNHADNARYSEYSHRYTQSGTFYPSVSIWNYLIDCSNQTLQLTSNNNLLPVHILIAISEFTISPNFIAWARKVPFNLVVFLGNGTWINLTIDWNDTTVNFFYIDIVPKNFNVCTFTFNFN